MSILGTWLNRALELNEDRHYHSGQKLRARELIESMSSAAGGLGNPALIRRCDEYARDVLGSTKYSPWLQAYAVFTGSFKEGWIPDNYYGRVVVPQWSGAYGGMSEYKSVSRRLFQTPLLPDLAYSVNGLLYTDSMEPVTYSQLKKYLFGTTERVVYKPDSGLQGKSVIVYDIDSFPDGPALFRNGVFQSYVVQHPFFSAFCSQAVATVRITTVVDDESNISCRAAYLRLPRSADTHVKSSSAIKVVINLEDGALLEKGYLPNWVPVDRHPDSGRAFAGQVAPNFAQCVDACISLHKKLPFSRMIGWDIVIDADQNAVLMEWNGGHNGIAFSEAATGPCFADLGWQNLWRSNTEAG